MLLRGLERGYVYVHGKKGLKKESAEIQVLKEACNRDKMNIDTLNNRGHYVEMQTLGGQGWGGVGWGG